MRLIDADVLWKDITSAYDDCEDILEIIDRQHTIEPRPKGKWVKEGLIWDGIFACDQCGEKTVQLNKREPLHNFCPNCGADMREGKQDG